MDTNNTIKLFNMSILLLLMVVVVVVVATMLQVMPSHYLMEFLLRYLQKL